MQEYRRRVSKGDYVIRSTKSSTTYRVQTVLSTKATVSWIEKNYFLNGAVVAYADFYGYLVTTYIDYYSSGTTKTREEVSDLLYFSNILIHRHSLNWILLQIRL